MLHPKPKSLADLSGRAGGPHNIKESVEGVCGKPRHPCFFFFFLYGCFVCIHECASYACRACRDQKRASLGTAVIESCELTLGGGN